MITVWTLIVISVHAPLTVNSLGNFANPFACENAGRKIVDDRPALTYYCFQEVMPYYQENQNP